MMRIDMSFDEITMKSLFKIIECPNDEQSSNSNDNYEREEIKNIVNLIEWFDQNEEVIK